MKRFKPKEGQEYFCAPYGSVRSFIWCDEGKGMGINFYNDGIIFRTKKEAEKAFKETDRLIAKKIAREKRLKEACSNSLLFRNLMMYIYDYEPKPNNVDKKKRIKAKIIEFWKFLKEESNAKD